MEKIEARIQKAMTADRDGLKAFLKDPSDKVVMALLANPHINYDDLLVLAKRRDLSSESLGLVAARKFSDEGYKVKLALVNNPRTPRRVALAMLKYLRLRDTAYLTQNRALPTELRQAAEGALKAKLVSLPLGVKITLARLVSEDVLKAMLMYNNPHLVKACFENPGMREATALWAVNHEKTPAVVVEFISMSPRWSVLQSVRFALLRNPRTPVLRAIELVTGLKSTDLRYLYNDPSVPVSVKVQIEDELERKGQPLSPPCESGRVIGIVDEDVEAGDV